MPMTFFAEKKHIFQLDPPETLTPKSKSGLVVKPFGACHPKKKQGLNRKRPVARSVRTRVPMPRVSVLRLLFLTPSLRAHKTRQRIEQGSTTPSTHGVDQSRSFGLFVLHPPGAQLQVLNEVLGTETNGDSGSKTLSNGLSCESSNF